MQNSDGGDGGHDGHDEYGGNNMAGNNMNFSGTMNQSHE